MKCAPQMWRGKCFWESGDSAAEQSAPSPHRRLTFRLADCGGAMCWIWRTQMAERLATEAALRVDHWRGRINSAKEILQEKQSRLDARHEENESKKEELKVRATERGQSTPRARIRTKTTPK